MINFSIFGVLLMISLIIITIFCDEEKTMSILIRLNIVFSLFINIGYVFVIGGFEFNYYRMFMPVTILIYFLKHRGPIAIKKNYFIPILVLYISLLMGFLFTFILKLSSDTYVAIGRSTIGDEPLTQPFFTSRNLVRTADLVIFVIYLLILLDYGFFKKEKLDYYINQFLIYTKAFFVLLIIELFFTYSGHGQLFRNSLFAFFGQNSESVIVTSYQRGGAYMLMGTLMEPSHVVYILLILYALYLKKYKISDAFIFFSWFIALISTSSSCLLCIPFSVIGYIFSNDVKNRLTRKAKVVILGSMMIFAVTALLLNSSTRELISLTVVKFVRFLNLNINDMNLRSSSDVRSYSIYVSLMAFLKNIPFGIGFGTVTTYSTIVSLLANLGLVGGASYFYMLYKIINPRLDLRYLSSFVIAVIYLIAVGMLGTAYNIIIVMIILPTYYERVADNIEPETTYYSLSTS